MAKHEQIATRKFGFSRTLEHTMRSQLLFVSLSDLHFAIGNTVGNL